MWKRTVYAGYSTFMMLDQRSLFMPLDFFRNSKKKNHRLPLVEVRAAWCGGTLHFCRSFLLTCCMPVLEGLRCKPLSNTFTRYVPPKPIVDVAVRYKSCRSKDYATCCTRPERPKTRVLYQKPEETTTSPVHAPFLSHHTFLMCTTPPPIPKS